ncbi:hypothetical protein ACROYT_G001231 [Oculina patagonica]
MNRLVLESFSRFSCKYWASNFTRVPTRLLHNPSRYFGNQLLSNRAPVEQRCAKCSLRRYFGSLTKSSQGEFSTKFIHAPSLYRIFLLLKREDVRQGVTRFFSTSQLRQHGQGDQHQQGDSQNPGEEPENQGGWVTILPWLMLALFYFLAAGSDPTPETTWSTFYREMLSTGEVEHLEVPSSQDKIFVFLHKGAMVGGKEIMSHGPHFVFSIASLDSFEQKMAAAQADLRIASNDFVPIRYRTKNELLSTALNAAVSIALLGFIWYWIYGKGAKGATKQGGILGSNPFSNYIKAKPTVVMPGSGKGISFKDVAGMEEAKLEVMEFVDYLKSPARYAELGAKIPKGALLVGPPGTGKTLLAKAVATEADVPFLTMAGSDFVEVFSGVGSARVRDLFTRARKLAPCILYIDEVDAIGRSRSSNSIGGGHSEQESTLNQLLVEMDGMNTMEGVVMLASTNRQDILDQALLRPGRFDRHIAIELPTLIERQAIFEVHLKKLTLKMPIGSFSKRLAELTPGNSGADIANICNEAALHAARLNKKAVDKGNFEYAVERVIAGMEKKTHTMSPEERKIVAFHEAGHALVGWMLEHTDPLLKVSIVPRTNATLGYAQYLPSDNKLYSTEQLFDRMCMALGGRAAEAKIFRRVTTGAEDDLQKVTDLAYKQVVTFGMSSRVGNVSFPVRKPSEPTKKFYSDKLAKLMDEEVRILIGKAFQTTNTIIEENLDKLNALAEELLTKEVLNYDDIVTILGPCPFGDKRVRFHSPEAASQTQSLFSG